MPGRLLLASLTIIRSVHFLPLIQMFCTCYVKHVRDDHFLHINPLVGGDPPRTDYELQEFFFNRIRSQLINDFNRRVCYNQTVYDDLRLEAREYAGLTLEVQDLVEMGGPTTINTVVDIEHAAFIIIDNDSKSSFLIVSVIL